MAEIEGKVQSFLKRYQATLQTIALIVILVMPFMLYAFAQAGEIVLVTVLLVVMALVMVGIIIIH